MVGEKRQVRVVWINGAFGVGKTTVANLLRDAVPGTVIVDPEEVGSLLRMTLQPVVPVHDFQEWGAWRDLVGATVTSVARELPLGSRGLVVVPQTITEETYWAQIIEGLGEVIELIPVSLRVEESEHRRRAEGDTEEPGALRWRLAKFGRFEDTTWIDKSFTVLDTTGRSPEDTVDELIELIGSR